MMDMENIPWHPPAGGQVGAEPAERERRSGRPQQGRRPAGLKCGRGPYRLLVRGGWSQRPAGRFQPGGSRPALPPERSTGFAETFRNISG